MNDVARASGLSNATVSNVLNERSGKTVSEQTRSRVLAAAAELGYVRNTAAATLRRGHSDVVLLVVDQTYTGEVSARTIAYMTDGMADAGCAVLVHRLGDRQRLVDAVLAVQPVAVMMLTFAEASFRDELEQAGARHVISFAQRPGEPEEEARFWEVSLGAAQVRLLAGAGHTSLGFIAPRVSPRLVIARSRLVGARAEAARLGLTEVTVLECDADRAALADVLPALREQGVTAVCAWDDRTGMAVLAAMADLGWRAPEDLAVVGADHDPESALTVPALTTVAIPDYDYGPDTARAMTAVLAGESVDIREAMARGLRTPEVHAGGSV